MSDRRPAKPVVSAATHTLGLHHGEVLLRLANTYPTITLTVVEAVQNAIDADAEKVFIGIDVQRRSIIVLDDGLGVTVDKFQEALLSVGKGIKRPGSLGRFGLGLISPLNKCTRYVFASQPVGERNVNWWEFEGDRIRGQHHEVQIPYGLNAELPAIPSQFRRSANGLRARWRTFVWLSGVTQDKVVGAADLDELEGQIRTKLGPGMRRKGTTAHIVLIDERGQMSDTRSVDPGEYTGERLPVVTYTDADCGEVRFELYRAHKTGGVRRGEVVFMRTGDNYPVLWRELFGQALGGRWLEIAKDALDALGSGYFEGVIYADKVELHQERTKFIWNEALRGLFMALGTWYSEHGQAHFEDEQEARRERRYQELGERSLAKIMGLLEKNTAFSLLARRLLGVLPGEEPVQQPRPGRGGSSDGNSGGSSGTRTKRPRVVANPPPNRDRPAQDREPHPTLRFAYEMLEHSTRLWEFDADSGMLTFNVRHPVWVSLDETAGRHTSRNDRQIMHLQEWLALKLLRLLSRHDDPDFDLEIMRIDVDDEVKYYAEMFILGNK